MIKSIEVKPKFLLVTRNTTNPRVIEFEDEKELRRVALERAEEGETVIVYKISSCATASSYPALKIKWK